MSAAAAAASLQAPSSSVVREVGKLQAVARMTMSGGSVGVASGVKIESPSTAPALSSHSQQTTTRIPTHSAFNGTALSQLPPTNGTNPLQCLQQMTVIGPDVKPDMSAHPSASGSYGATPTSTPRTSGLALGSQKLCTTSAATNSNSNYPLGFTEQWAAAFTQQLGGGNSGYFNNAFNVPTSTMFNYPVLAAGGPPPFIDPTTGRISGAWADLDPTKKGKGRQTYNRQQTHTLENTFLQNRYVTRKQRAELERQTGLTDRQIKIWFQNRRMKAKKDGHRQADEQGQQQPNNGASSQQPLIAHPPTPTSSGQLNVPKSADVRANSIRNDGANLRHSNLTPPLSRGMDHAAFCGYNCHFPSSAYPHLPAFTGQFSTMDTDGRSQKGVSFPASASSMSTSNGQMWGQGCFDAWQMMNTMDSTTLSMIQQQSLAALSTTPIGCYNGGGGGGSFQPNPPQACAPSGTSNPAGYHQYTANENR